MQRVKETRELTTEEAVQRMYDPRNPELEEFIVCHVNAWCDQIQRTLSKQGLPIALMNRFAVEISARAIGCSTDCWERDERDPVEGHELLLEAMFERIRARADQAQLFALDPKGHA